MLHDIGLQKGFEQLKWPPRLPEVIRNHVVQKRICNFLLTLNSNHSSILHRFLDTAIYWPNWPIFYTLSKVLRSRLGDPVEYRNSD